MKKLIVFLSLVFAGIPGVSHADCTDRLVNFIIDNIGSKITAETLTPFFGQWYNYDETCRTFLDGKAGKITELDKTIGPIRLQFEIIWDVLIQKVKEASGESSCLSTFDLSSQLAEYKQKTSSKDVNLKQSEVCSTIETVLKKCNVPVKLDCRFSCGMMTTNDDIFCIVNDKYALSVTVDDACDGTRAWGNNCSIFDCNLNKDKNFDADCTRTSNSWQWNDWVNVKNNTK